MPTYNGSISSSNNNRNGLGGISESDPLLLTVANGQATRESESDSDSSSNDDTARRHVVHWQRRCGILAQILCLVAMAVVSAWVYLLGGLGWRPGKAQLAFNWHPLLMTAAFCLMTVASLAFRFPIHRDNNRKWTKYGQHALLWLGAAFCIVFAIVGVFHAHDDPISGLIANLYSLRPWLCIVVLILYAYQLSVGGTTFATNLRNLKPVQNASVLRFHQALGPVIYLSMAVTILVGIQEKESLVSCRYRVTEVTYWPQLDKIPVSCWSSHALAFLIVMITVFTLFALQRFG